MVLAIISANTIGRPGRVVRSGVRRSNRAFLLALPVLLAALLAAGGQTVSERPSKKRVIGATAVLTEMSTGIPFAARVDTGAASCSIHVEEMEIENEAPRPLDNIGKTVRFVVKNEKDQTGQIEAKIARVVRIRSSVQKDGEFDRRYKVRLALSWKDFRKEVLVTLNDRTEMTYPLLLGRNYLRGDFLVDVDIDNPD